ncbi:glycoside hydrolase family 5 protein [Jaapia argillacea MUCL 33604]|uniref:glucan 1,3-beta-glucosidase n=1 Tax=Jaapia argillacea MUCL 33604 TaxID=933084 RepID=A0A067Q3E3_9AGAM|nr:glycoside hydrolase family 5 protein [Jaapia argillacea MUCL 33604]
MASRQPQHVPYEPLPNLTDSHHEGLYDPSSPDPQSLSFHNTPQNYPVDLPDDIPGSRPRFLGAAATEAGFSRDSYASGQTYHSYNDNSSSVYQLNPPSRNESPVPGRQGAGSVYGAYKDDPREYGSTQDMALSSMGGAPRYLEEKRTAYAPPRAKSKRKLMILAGIAGLILLILAVVIPLYFAVFKPKGSTQNDATTGGSSSAAQPSSTQGSGTPGKPSSAVVTGGDGSKVTTEDGTTFTYSNKFGGFWYFDPANPFNNYAQAQSWTPALNQTFTFGTNRIKGVNLGGWLVTEPFMQVGSSPALYEKYPSAVDEWTLSVAMAADTANGGLSQLETHYKTFITEQDFAEIAGAGLNFVRIPIAYWAIETRGNEPFLAKTSWTYFLKAIEWARKYGIRINVDLHALPGSQNGWNHSGKLGDINVLNGPMGLANAQRSLDYIRIIAEFISQPQYADVVVMFGITNEPQAPVIGQNNLERYYLQAYNLVRTASGIGAGNGPFISYHDGFLDRTQWAGFLPGADRIALDSHPYICFGAQSNAAMSTYATTPCTTWGSSFNQSMTAFGMTGAGEFSNAVTDCGKWVNGVGLGTRYEGNYTGYTTSSGSCTTWTDYQAWTPATKAATMQFALASMDALQNWFFWTWKIGNSSVSGQIESPSWSYQLGLQNGWMPLDPRQADGTCGNTAPWNGPLQSYQTGGAGAGQIPASATASIVWPPATISSGGAASLLPSYTPTGPIPTLPVPTFTQSSSKATISAGNGWQNPSDSAGAMVAIATCSYLDPWVGPNAAPPSPLCSGAAKREVPEPTITPAP